MSHYRPPFLLALSAFVALNVGMLAPLSSASAMEEGDLSYTQVSKQKPRARLRCKINDGNRSYKTIQVIRNGQRLRLPARAKKKFLAVREIVEGSRRFPLWACLEGDSPNDNGTLVVKDSAQGEPRALGISIDDFESVGGGSGNLGQVCSSTQPLPSSFIYKTVGSNHFNDCRRNTAGLIVEAGARGPFPSETQVYDSKGNLRAQFGQYSPAGFQWAYRAYACWGSGKSTPFSGAKIAADARKATGSSNVYLRMGTKCYGPIDAGRCYNSSSC